MRIEKCIWVNDLVENCPFGMRLSSCTFTELREMSVLIRKVHLNTMNYSEIERLIKDHCACFSKRSYYEKRFARKTDDELRLGQQIHKLMRLR